MNPTLTEALARAAATDKANRRMRKAGRTAWDESDYAAAVREYWRLRPDGAGVHCVNSKLV